MKCNCGCDEEYYKDDGIPISSPPFILSGIWKPNKKVVARLGYKKNSTFTETNNKGQWIIDLNNCPFGYSGYKYVYVNKKRFKLIDGGGMRIKLEDKKNESK